MSLRTVRARFALLGIPAAAFLLHAADRENPIPRPPQPARVVLAA